MCFYSRRPTPEKPATALAIGVTFSAFCVSFSRRLEDSLACQAVAVRIDRVGWPGMPRATEATAVRQIPERTSQTTSQLGKDVGRIA